MTCFISYQYLNYLSGRNGCRIIYLAVLLYLFTACTHENPAPELTEYQKEVIAYFDKVALGFEFGSASEITRKWRDDMMVFMGGEKNETLKKELGKIVNEINGLATDGFEITVVEDSLLSNFYLYLGTGDDYAERYPSQSDKVDGNFGLFTVYWDGNNHINRGHMYVDTHRAQGNAQKHLLREELTQSLGLARDAPDYPESIFQQAWTTTTTYAPIDKELIRLLYHPRMTSGLDKLQANEVLRTIFLNE